MPVWPENGTMEERTTEQTENLIERAAGLLGVNALGANHRRRSRKLWRDNTLGLYRVSQFCSKLVGNQERHFRPSVAACKASSTPSQDRIGQYPHQNPQHHV